MNSTRENLIKQGMLKPTQQKQTLQASTVLAIKARQHELLAAKTAKAMKILQAACYVYH